MVTNCSTARAVRSAAASVVLASSSANIVAAEPRDEIPGTGQAPDAGGDLLKEGVSRGVPVQVVDRLEAIEIDHQQHVHVRGVGHHLVEAAFEVTAVRRPRQRVVQGGVVVDLAGVLQRLRSAFADG